MRVGVVEAAHQFESKLTQAAIGPLERRYGEQDRRFALADFHAFRDRRHRHLLESGADAQHQAARIAHCHQLLGRCFDLPEGDVAAIGTFLKKVIDGRGTEEARTLPIAPEHPLQTRRKQHERLAARQAQSYEVVHGDVDKRILSGHFGTCHFMACKQINRFLIARQCLWVQKVGRLSIDKVNPAGLSTCEKSNCAAHNDIAMHNIRCYIGFMNET